jgi:hypothetical protein
MYDAGKRPYASLKVEFALHVFAPFVQLFQHQHF